MEGTRDTMEVEKGGKVCSRVGKRPEWSRKTWETACINTALRSRLQTQHFSQLSGTNFECLSALRWTNNRDAVAQLLSWELNKGAFTAKWTCQANVPLFCSTLSHTHKIQSWWPSLAQANPWKGVCDTALNADLRMSRWIIQHANVTRWDMHEALWTSLHVILMYRFVAEATWGPGLPKASRQETK